MLGEQHGINNGVGDEQMNLLKGSFVRTLLLPSNSIPAKKFISNNILAQEHDLRSSLHFLSK